MTAGSQAPPEPTGKTAAAAVAPSKRSERLNTKAAGIIGMAVMFSRVLGLAREQICASLFGGGAAMDAFTAAFRIPNLLRDLFAEGALSTAFVTTFSKTIERGGDAAAWRLANKVATLTAVVLGSICVLGIVFAPTLVAGFAPGWSGEKAALTVTLTRIMFPFILMVSLAALVMGMLNSKNVFGMPAMASSFFNIGSITGGVLLGYWIDPHFGPRALMGLAVGTLLGGALQLGVQLPRLIKLGYRPHWDMRWRDPGIRAILLLMGPSVIASSTTQLNVLANSIFATELGDGRVFWLQVAFRLMQLPLGLFGVALGTVSLPLLSRLAVGHHMREFGIELSHGLRLAFLLTLPATIGLMMLAEPIISVLYQHGRFTAYEAAQAAGALRYYAVGLCGYAALKVLVNAFYAIDRRKTPMIVSFMAVGLNLLFNWIFTFHLGWGHRGLAFSTGCVASCNFLVLYWLMRRRLGGLHSGLMLRMLLRLLPAVAAMVAVCWLGSHFWLADWATQALGSKLLALIATIALAATVFIGGAWSMHVDDLHDLVAAFAAARTVRRAELARRGASSRYRRPPRPCRTRYASCSVSPGARSN